ncbi:MAG: hypothetical protein PVH40_06955 [Gemmatimonadales bacterium]|jgi:hypothetical protein
MRSLAILAALAIAVTVPCHGQVPTPTGGTVPAADPADVESIDAILSALYDVISGPAGQARNWDRFRSLFVDGARLSPTGLPQGSSTVRTRFMSVEDYVAGSGGFIEERGFFESEVGRITEQFGAIAHAFSSYQSQWTPDGEVFQRGINSIQLLWDNQRWWILSIFWWGVGPDEELPARYFPGGH